MPPDMPPPRFNPFRPGRIAGPGMFAGRGDELEALERILSQTKEGNAQHFLLAGERGIGKSSLLLFLKVVATGAVPSEPLRFAVAEIELDPACTYSQLIKQMAAALRRALAPYEKLREGLKKVWDVVKNIEAGGIKYTSGAAREDHELLDDLVAAFVDAATALREDIDGILVLVDEADKAPTGANLGSFCKIFTDRLTKQECDNVCIGLAGATGVVQRLRSSHESAPRIFTTFSLKPLEDDERREVVRKGLDHGNRKIEYESHLVPMTITEEALTLIASLSEGFPHFIQQFAYSAFERDTDATIDVQDVLDGALSENGALDQLGQKYFEQMYFEQINSNEYRSVLQAMAQTSATDGWVTKAEIRAATGLKETTLGNAIHTLKDREIIQPKVGEIGVYRLPSLSFAAWIRARHLSARVREEKK